MKRRLVVIVGLATAAVVAAGVVARSDAAPSRTSAQLPLLRVGQLASYTSFDPNKSFGNGPSVIQTGEFLMRIDDDGSVKGNLAERMTQPGPAVYVFHLRKGVRFW